MAFVQSIIVNNTWAHHLFRSAWRLSCRRNILLRVPYWCNRNQHSPYCRPCWSVVPMTERNRTSDSGRRTRWSLCVLLSTATHSYYRQTCAILLVWDSFISSNEIARTRIIQYIVTRKWGVASRTAHPLMTPGAPPSSPPRGKARQCRRDISQTAFSAIKNIVARY